MAATRNVEITPYEAMFLSDSLVTTTEGPDFRLDSSDRRAYPDLLTKIGIAFIHNAPLEIALTWNELWMIRDVTKSSVKIGSESVGMNLLAKVYGAILTMQASPAVAYAIESVAAMEVIHDDAGEERLGS